MINWLSNGKTDKVIHTVETDIVRLVVEIHSVGKSFDEFDKETGSAGGLQPKQADLSCVHALNELHSHEIRNGPRVVGFKGLGEKAFGKMYSSLNDLTLQGMVENQNNVKVKQIRTDNGTEFRYHELEIFCDEKGSFQNFSSPYTPEQNGVAERKNRTLIEAARTMLNESGDISYVHVFGCHVFIHNHKDHLGKFDAKADDGYFLGYFSVSKAFRVYNRRRQQIEETYHVTFDEIPYLTSQIKPLQVLIPLLRIDREQHIKLVNIIGNPGEGMLTRSMVGKLTVASACECLFVDFLSEIEPKKVSEALKHLGWIDAMQEELNQFYKNKPTGFESSEFLDYVCKLDKALYGLKQAPRAWDQSNTKESHLIAVKRILRFLKGTPALGLYYPKCLSFDLKGYSDSDYASCNMDRKSTSAEAEYVVAARCYASILWMKSQLIDYDIHYKMVPIFCDNTNAIAISNNPVLHSRTKHIDIRYHFIRDHILKGYIELHFFPTEYQLADIFTKPLDEPTFTRLKA
nr:retrovirus-related Pol polyprotein from transposon TNT 1-94 [Tanacetum cinerariifolium]